jgi:hypothetical protein
VFDPVLVEERHAILRADEVGGQTLRHLRGPGRELGPGHRPVVLDQRGTVGAVHPVDADDVGEAVDVPHGRRT